jgi:predicted 3-demethylubiquinone-9 3-methyltransferase (glyoxalase superfamily)
MKNQMYPCLWFEKEALEAAEFYCSVFPNSKIVNSSPLVVNFIVNGQYIMALNDRSNLIQFTEAFSMVVNCDSQEEIDLYWSKLTSEGGMEGRCGWCTDKYGISWQIVPAILGQLMSNPTNTQRVVAAFIKMNKLDIATLTNA